MTFRSGRFETGTPAADSVDRRCFGEDLAGWLREALDASFKPGDVIQEDYGWGFWTESGGDPYWVYVGVMDESIGQEKAEWLVGIVHDPGLNPVRRLFRRPEAADLRALCSAVDAVLQRDASVVQDIEWWQDEPQVGTPSTHPV